MPDELLSLNSEPALADLSRCDHVCLLPDGHVDHGQPHFYGYETPSPRPKAKRQAKARTTTAIRFPEQLHEALAIAAEERDFSINYLVVKAVEDFLPRLKPATELKLTK